MFPLATGNSRAVHQLDYRNRIGLSKRTSMYIYRAGAHSSPLFRGVDDDARSAALGLLGAGLSMMLAQIVRSLARQAGWRSAFIRCRGLTHSF